MFKKTKKWLYIITAVTLVFYGLHYIIPNHIILFEGEKFNAGPILNNISNTEGKQQIRLFGIMPVKTVYIDVIKNTALIPSGKTVGIKININGVMVVSFSSIRGADGKKYLPAQKAGIKKGDVILKVNNFEVSSVPQLVSQLKASGENELTFLVDRDGKQINVEVKPIISKDDNETKIGAWVRESSSGIGTITYINPADGSFGALGHGISDLDTKKLIPAVGGDILNSNIQSVKKGNRGNPGELRGSFSMTSKIGTVKMNTDNGVFGILTAMPQTDFSPLPVAPRSQVVQGAAYILSNIEGETVKKYSINIENVLQTSFDNKGIIIKITDDELIKKTGGIVQGMSGSPIIQNEHIVGAVTHVFINDPVRGYATFMDVMLNGASSLKDEIF
ncbi:MAG: SpoIVB peptidase [Firmicutes bacterium]|nr:SpoIVB peptidase [Bacillota bacterium]